MAVLLMGVMVLSSLAAITAVNPARVGSEPSSIAVTSSVAGSGVPPPATLSAAAATLESQISANSAKYAAIAQSLEEKGVKPNLIHLPSSEPAGYIDGQLVPGPEYALDTLTPVGQGYSSPPAPSGIAYYGQSGSDVSGSKVATVLDTSSLEGSLNVQNLTSLYLDTDNPDQWGGQLNAVLLNLSLEGSDTISSDPVAIWAQNVVSYQSLTDTLTLVDNTWNFTSTSESFPASGTGTVVANDTSDIDYGGELYIGAGPTFYAPAPYSVNLYLNTSLYNPFICTSDSSVADSSTCANPVTGTAAYVGDQTLFYNYTFSDAVTGQKVSGTFDWLTFHTGKSSLFDPTNTRVAGFEASGGKKGTIGILNDWELDFGIGAYDGANQNVLSANGTATLDYLPDCTKATSSTPSTCTPSSSHTYQSVPAALDFGSQTGETGLGMNIGYTGTTATFNAGPFNLHALWGYTSQAGINPGAVQVTNAVQVSGSPLTLTQQPYIFVFLEDTSVATPTATYSWAPDVPTWYLMPGTYKWEALLSDYTEQTGTLTLTAGTPATLSATLPYATSNGVYTPLWAFSNAQLAGISSSGSGTISSQYMLFNNPTSGTGNPLNTIFNTKDDYDFPSYAGILLSGTTAYVDAHAEPTFYVGSTGLYLQQQLYRTEHVTVSNAADINGWEDMESLLGSVAAQNPIPQANLMVWDSSSDLVYDNNFVAIKAASGFVSPDLLMFYGGTDNVVWGNTFNDPSSATKTTPGTYAGIAEAENGDLIYNNNFEVDNPVPFLPWNPYTETGPVTYSDTWNIAEQAASNVAYTVNGFALSGNIVGSQPFQGGNEWWNYGNSLNPAATTPFRNVVDYTDYASIFPPGFGADEAGMAVGGDNVPLPGFTLTFTESGLPTGTAWSVTILGVTESSTTTSLSFAGVPNGAYSYKVGLVPGWTTTSTGTATVDGAAKNVGVAFAQSLYDVTFTASGLPSGTEWSVTLNGDLGSSTGTSISFSEPNGTYDYTVGSVAGYTVTPSSGSVTVAGAATGVALTYSPVDYSVTFTESGLSANTMWSVALNGNPGTSTGSSISFTEPNGTYAFSVGAIAGYHAAPSSGSVTVDGAAVVQPITFAAVSYSVSFSESGLPFGTTFSVTLNGTPQSVSANGGTETLDFEMPNGTYSYSIAGVPGWQQSTLASSGTVVVDGASVVEPTLAYTQVTYSVTFTESGLPAGTFWSVTLDEQTGNSIGSSIVFSEPNGTYGYTIGAVPGYAPSAASGAVTVDGSPVVQGVSFTAVTYPVSFSESGLPMGQTFGVTLNGVPESLTTDGGVDTLAFAEANGSYAYAIAGVAGWSQSTLPGSGSVTVDGAAVAEPTLAYTQVTYSVTFTESGLPSGTPWSVTLNGTPMSSSSASIAFTEPNGSFPYTVAAVPGYTPDPASGSVTVNGGAASVAVSFSAVTYAVTFTESGLPSGTSWSITLNGDHESSTTSAIVFSEANGTYDFTVGHVAGYVADPVSGSVTVDGAAVSTGVAFSVPPPGTYAVTFTEGGLPAGTSWSVSIGGTPYSSTGATIAVMLTNGTYSYTVGAVAGYVASPASGSFTVNGASVSESVSFTPTTYTVTFSESGLPAGKEWAVAFNGVATESAATTISFTASDGTYLYLIQSEGAYWAQGPVTFLAPEGNLTVNGQDLVISVEFVHHATVTLTFKETGVASGTSWCVTVGAKVCTTATKLQFKHLTPAGYYEYSVGSVGTATTQVTRGHVAVPASAWIAFSKSLTFKVAYTYPVTFTETGLPSGTEWKVTAGSVSGTSTTDTIVLYLTNGSYTYHVVKVTGYTAAPTSGHLTVAGAAQLVSVTFTTNAHHGTLPGTPLAIARTNALSARAE